MTVTPTSIKAQYPQFSGLEDTFLQAWIDKGYSKHAAALRNLDLVVEYWTLSKITEQDQAKRLTTGPVTSHSKDGVSWSTSDKGEGHNMWDNLYRKEIYLSYLGPRVV